MILKELDPFHGDSQFDLAVRTAADQLAYYLRRFYRRSAEVDVLNGLHVASGDTTARVDHLLLHAHGMLVIEREEIAGSVQIDDDGQWSRWTVDGLVAMGSPITRAYVQGLLLKAMLDRRVRQKGFFDQLELDVLVVVSDSCEVVWPTTGRLPEVCKREEVHARVEARLEQCRNAARRPGPLSATERRVLGEFLQHIHTPDPTGS